MPLIMSWSCWAMRGNLCTSDNDCDESPNVARNNGQDFSLCLLVVWRDSPEASGGAGGGGGAAGGDGSAGVTEQLAMMALTVATVSLVQMDPARVQLRRHLW